MADIDGRGRTFVYLADVTRSRDQDLWNQELKNLGNVAWLHLHSKFERHQAAQVYESVDVVVLPSIYLEVYGLVVAEALSAGRPVLSYSAAADQKIRIEDGVNGWLVNQNDPLEMCKIIQKLAYTPSIVATAALNCKLKKSHTKYVDEMEKLFNVS
jgi:glycosyltransferase involved in cell wall biosynthesis